MITRFLPVLAATVCAALSMSASAPETQQTPFVPIDPQQVQDQEMMTWKDYRPMPGTNWADNALPGERVLRVALVAVDFPISRS